MKLNVANCTKQNYIFAYRVPEENGVKQIPIRIGQQITLPGDFSMPQITNDSNSGIVDQHRKYGMIDVNDINRTEPFIGICFSIGKVINVDKIMTAMSHNDEVLIQRGRQLRQMSAVASNNLIEHHLHEANERTGGDAQLSDFEVTIEEESQRGNRDESLLKEGVNVSKDQENSETSFENRNRGKSRRRRGN